MALRGFTVSRRLREDSCPHQCGHWAVRIGVEKPIGADGKPHNENCPLVREPGKCGYCGSKRGSNEDNTCVDCGGV